MTQQERHSAPSSPPVIRRLNFWWLMTMFVTSILAVIWATQHQRLGVPWGGWYKWIPLGISLTPFVATAIWSWRLGGIRRAMRESEGRLCVYCAYNVTAHEPKGICPECGKTYDHAQNAEIWANANVDLKTFFFSTSASDNDES